MACTSLPVINNGYITASASGRVEYECLAGFELFGNKVIDCDAVGGWPSAPACRVITKDVSFTDSSNDQFRFGPDWWYIVISIILCIFLILCIIGFIWCCLCKKWRGATVHPTDDVKKIEVGEYDHAQKRRESHNTKPTYFHDPLTPVETNRYPTSSVFVVSNTEDKKSPTETQKRLQETNDKYLANNRDDGIRNPLLSYSGPRWRSTDSESSGGNTKSNGFDGNKQEKGRSSDDQQPRVHHTKKKPEPKRMWMNHSKPAKSNIII